MIFMVGVVCAGCDPAPPGPPAPPPNPTAIYGDSLTWVIPTAIPGADVRSYPGTTVVNWSGEIAVDHHPVVILALGSNDAIGEGVAPWGAVLNSLPASTCVIWPMAYRAASRPAIAPFDDALRPLLRARPRTHIIDWDATAAAHPEYLGPDGLHYTPAGVDAYRAMLAAAPGVC